MNFTFLVVIWSAMALIVLLTAVYRKYVARGEDNLLHLHNGDNGLVQHQEEVARQIEVIDKVGKISTVVVAVGGLAIAAAYLYQVWQQTSQLPY